MILDEACIICKGGLPRNAKEFPVSPTKNERPILEKVSFLVEISKNFLDIPCWAEFNQRDKYRKKSNDMKDQIESFKLG